MTSEFLPGANNSENLTLLPSAAGKPGKVAVIAAMRKLLTAVWSVATHRKPFVPYLPGVSAPLGAVTCKA